MCISHFSRISVISSFFKLSSGCFSFSMIFSFLSIFHVLQWTSKFSTFFSFPRHISRPNVCISHLYDFQVSRHNPGPTVCISHFSHFSVISSFFKSSIGCFSFSMIFCFLAIFYVLLWGAGVAAVLKAPGTAAKSYDLHLTSSYKTQTS